MATVVRCDRCGSEEDVKTESVTLRDVDMMLYGKHDLCSGCRSDLATFLRNQPVRSRNVHLPKSS